jgi:succinate dehydrogenase / fumarate reductase cytochrome b subunit
MFDTGCVREGRTARTVARLGENDAMSTNPRPLSPHLQVYRWQLTMTMSILHRITGVALAVGTLLLVWWLLAAAAGPEVYETARTCLGSWVGRLLLFGWSFALFYHLLNGIRHLGWDLGLGFEIKTAYATGWTVWALSILLTLVTWVAAYAAMGAL